MAGIERVYSVEDEESISMVIATSQTQALNHVVKGKYKVKVASGIDVADFMSQGGTLDRATKADESDPAPVEPEAEADPE